MNIAVIGTGYVGLVAGACFADTGNSVICVDKDKSKIDRLNNGKVPIYEPGLETLVHRGSAEGRLQFTTSTPDAVKKSEIIFMAVGTPPLPSGEPDLKYLKAAAEEIAMAMDGYRLIVNKSTVPIGSHQVVAEWIQDKTQHSVDVCSNPEFLKEGAALDDFLKPDRVVIGTHKREVYEIMSELYSPFVRQGNPILWMDPVSAELTKYACNAFLATRVSFMNELSVLCEKVNGDIESIRKGMTTDVRIGKHFLYPGVGYGGSCFPKDVQALLATARREEVPMGIIEATENANTRQKLHMIDRVKTHFRGELEGKTFAIWGLAFKPDTDDIREAPALVMIEELLKQGAKVQAYDPVAMENVREIFHDRVSFSENSSSALQNADALILVTEWREFRHPDFTQIKNTLRKPVIFDGRNLYPPDRLKQMGFAYYGIGRS